MEIWRDEKRGDEARRLARVRPAGPAPMIAIEGLDVMVCCGHWM